MTFQIITLGCKVNIYESEIMQEKMIQAGYKLVSNNADITIINTCTVTNMADKKSQKMVRQMKKKNPDTILVVAGCSSENKQEEYQKYDIDILIGNKDKSKIVELIESFQTNHQKITKFYHTRDLPFEDMTIEKFESHTRAFLKIQDGCNNFCSYCIIPYVRGTTRSKDFDSCIEEAKQLAEHHCEIVLTGIHTGSYSSQNHDLTDLIHEMSKIEKIKRIRISSIEITELNDKFFQELKNNPKICDHLHIPLQAGSNEILKKMNRKYDLQYFEKKLNQIRAIRSDISISTDVIVGHPYETEDLFQKTLQTVEKFKFSKVHAFPYSKREGTLAAKMECQIEEWEKKERNRKLIQLSQKLEYAYAKKFQDKSVEVLIEENKEHMSYGHTSNYLKIALQENVKKNTFCNVKIIDSQKDINYGKIEKRESIYE